MKIVDNETKRVFKLEMVYYDKFFKRTIYEFHAMNYGKFRWSIPVYNNESLEEVLKKCNLTIDNN